MFRGLWIRASLFAIAAMVWFPGAQALELQGEPIQGGLIFGLTEPGNQVFLDDTKIMVSDAGKFLIGFGRDETGERLLRIKGGPHGDEQVTLTVTPRVYKLEKVDGLPPKTVTPDPTASKRIADEITLVSSARARRDSRTDYAPGFIWPAQGRISGVYGSQRILNGKPRRPHYGLDIAAPKGSPVYAPAAGIVTLSQPDMYFSGGTLILDHGQGLSSSFLHLSKILVEAGTTVQQGELIAEIGATGRASGPHLDWRMNWLNRRVDPQLLMKEKPGPE